VPLSLLVKDIKLASHKMILENGSMFLPFPGWQVGYSAFTYHISAKENLIGYVENQREHHMVFSSNQELTKMLSDNSVDHADDYLLT
jgi:putative transposase